MARLYEGTKKRTRGTIARHIPNDCGLRMAWGVPMPTNTSTIAVSIAVRLWSLGLTREDPDAPGQGEALYSEPRKCGLRRRMGRCYYRSLHGRRKAPCHGVRELECGVAERHGPPWERMGPRSFRGPEDVHGSVLFTRTGCPEVKT